MRRINKVLVADVNVFYIAERKPGGKVWKLLRYFFFGVYSNSTVRG